MNDFVNKFLLTCDKFMPEMHLKQPGFTHSACGPFSRNKKRIKKFMQTGNTDFIYKNDLDKFVFNMMWLMVNRKIYQEELSQTKF